MNRAIDKNIYDIYFKKPWYLHHFTIAILFAAWILIIPPIIGIVLLVINALDNIKKKKLFADLNIDKSIQLEDIEKKIALKTKHNQALINLKNVQNEIDKLKQQYKVGTKKLKELKSKIIETEGIIDVQDAGFYEFEYDISTSAEYKTKMIELQDKQKAMVKNKTACYAANDTLYNGSLTDGKKMVRHSVKMKLWSFNTHCDSVIANVSYRNRDLSERKIRKAFDVLNENDNLSSISYEYLQLKLEELKTTYEHKEQLQHEKELLREEREREREDRKLKQEIARERAKLEKDETHINTELARLQKLLFEEKSDKQKLQKEVDSLEKKLERINKRKDEVDFREAHAKAGYVYVISNVGAFGRDVLKIGVTRRLEPIERINELSSASVPFRFDVHALIFSHDAFKLEKALHDRFTKQRINQINNRKEFFRIPLEDVQKAIVQEFGGNSVVFHMQPEAKEFRQSIEKLKLRQLNK